MKRILVFFAILALVLGLTSCEIIFGGGGSRCDVGDHIFDNWVFVSDDCQSKLYSRVCLLCSETEERREPSQHENQPFYDEAQHWYECKKCGLIFEKVNHNMTDGKCAGCKYRILFDYELSGDHYVIVKYYGGESHLTIPTEYNGLPVTAIGDLVFEANKELVSVIIPESITSIGECAFKECVNLTEVTLPESLTEIGDAAFAFCKNLKAIAIPTGVTVIPRQMLDGCESLVNLTLGDEVTEIGDWAFVNCQSLDRLVIPDTVTSISNGAFYYSRIAHAEASLFALGYMPRETLETVKITTMGGEDTIPYYFFDDAIYLREVIFPEGVKGIGEYAFYGCGKLEKISLPDELTHLGMYAFYGCKSLPYIDIPEGVTALPERAFEGCTALGEVTFPEGLTAIADSCFEGCTGIRRITIPKSVTSIGYWAFRGCSGLTNLLILGEGLTVESPFYECDSLAVATVPSEILIHLPRTALKKVTVTYGDTIPEGALADCKNLTEVILPEGIEVIEHGAFESCTSLPEIHIPEGVKTIEPYAFSYCVTLPEIALPKSVETIGEYAFAGCSSLVTATTLDGVLRVGDGVFSDCASLENITLPDSITYVGEDVVYKTAYSENDENYENGLLYVNNHILFARVDEASGDIVIKDGTRTIAAFVFEGARKITSVSLPESMVYIGRSAFHDCTSLTSVNIPKGIKEIPANTFSGCNLSEIIIPEGIVSVGESAFLGNSGARVLSLPSTLEALGTRALYSLYSLESISVAAGNPCYRAEGGCLIETATSTLLLATSSNATIPDYVRVIGEGAFHKNKQESITIPDSVTHIGASAFSSCTKLTKLHIGCGVKEIGEGAFMGCISLTEVTVPESVETIGKGAFRNCSRLDAVKLSNGLRTIGNSAFLACSRLAEITLPDTLESIGDGAFTRCKITSITIPKNVKFIGKEAFDGCDSLASVTFAEPEGWSVSLTKDGEGAIAIDPASLTDTASAKDLLTQTYLDYYWQK